MKRISNETKKELMELTGFSVEDLLQFALGCASNKCEGLREAYESVGDIKLSEYYKRLGIAIKILVNALD